MKKTECVKKGGDIRDCIKEDKDSCTEYRTAYYECKRGALDMRNRIRGQPGFQQ
jgi:hypothetical protein